MFLEIKQCCSQYQNQKKIPLFLSVKWSSSIFTAGFIKQSANVMTNDNVSS